MGDRALCLRVRERCTGDMESRGSLFGLRGAAKQGSANVACATATRHASAAAWLNGIMMAVKHENFNERDRTE